MSFLIFSSLPLKRPVLRVRFLRELQLRPRPTDQSARQEWFHHQHAQPGTFFLSRYVCFSRPTSPPWSFHRVGSTYTWYIFPLLVAPGTCRCDRVRPGAWSTPITKDTYSRYPSLESPGLKVTYSTLSITLHRPLKKAKPHCSIFIEDTNKIKKS